MRIDEDALFVGQHLDNAMGWHSAERIKAILFENQSDFGHGSMPRQVVDWHGVDQRPIAVEDNGFCSVDFFPGDHSPDPRVTGT